MLQTFSADYIFPIASPPIKKGVVVADDKGQIIDVLPPEKFGIENFNENIKHNSYRGIICPGFINAHCHLELSHLQGKFEEGKSLPGFIGQIISGRKADKQVILDAMFRAEETMIRNGIVGVGDICNTDDSVEVKRKKRIHYHNFIELFDIIPENAEKEFEKGIALKEKFEGTGKVSLTPHAPYTVSPHLLNLIYEYAYTRDSILSIHNQETESENEMFEKRSGVLFEKLSSFGTLYEKWKSTGYSSLSSTLVHLPKCNKTLLVHNTFSTEEDINWAHLYSSVIYWCFCPNANLYIENRLPDFQLFIDHGCKILVGTDSYASNKSLSILEELKTISRHAPKIKLDILLQWATLNGAEFFGWKKDLGSLEKGKKPGINLLTDVDTENLALTATSRVKRLL
jgi:cytosine/adenosine deaminase-related metal-dependent hydrolase